MRFALVSPVAVDSTDSIGPREIAALGFLIGPYIVFRRKRPGLKLDSSIYHFFGGVIRFLLVVVLNILTNMISCLAEGLVSNKHVVSNTLG